MVKIKEFDRVRDICSCCENMKEIIIELDSALSEMTFCESCWKEFIDKAVEYTY